MDNKAGNNHVRASQKQGIRPGFLGGTDKATGPAALTDETKIGAKKAGARESAAEGLRKSEESASGGLYRSEDSLAGTRGMEREPRTGFYSGGGKSKGKGKGNTKGKGTFKKGGPFIGIILAIFGFGGVMMGSQMFQPFSLVAQFQEKFNSMSVSTNLRSSRFIKWQMGDITDGNVKDPIKGTVFGGKKLKITKTQKEKLKNHGIEYKEDVEVDGKKTKALVFTNDAGEQKIVTAKNFDDVYINDAEFHSAYNAGSKTWRGMFANWFGSTVINFLTNNKLTRNMFNDFRERVDSSPGKSSMDVFKEVISEKIQGGETAGGVKTSKGEQDVDEDGNGKLDKNNDPSYKTETETDADSGKTFEKGKVETDQKSVSGADLKTEANIKQTLDGISAKFQTSVNLLCAGFQFVGTVSAIVAAAEALQIINLTTAAFETVDKVKAGYGDESPIHDLTSALNSKTTNVNYTLTGTDAQVKDLGNDQGQIGDLKFVEADAKEKSAMESAGIAALYGNGKVDANDPSVASFNISSSVNRVLGGLAVTGASFASCTIAKMTASVASGVMDAVGAVGCIGAFFTAGATGGACVELIISIGKKVALSVGIAVLLSGIISVLMPVVKNALLRDLVSNIGGEDFGNALTSGANMYQGGAHRSAGGSLATADQYTSYLVEQQAVIADNARYERETLSPFDITSKYTFMGTLMTQLMSFNVGSGTLMSMIKAGSSALSSSLVAMSPTASAYNISEVIPDMNEYEKICPYLASIGAVGDAFCNPYVMTDTGTMNYEPEKVIEKVQNNLKDELTSEGNVIIDESSDLAKYIVYCNNRESQFGIADYNIADTVSNFATFNTSSSGFNTVSNSAIGALPVIGDGIDIINDVKQMNHMGYISGESCVAGNTVQYASSPDWKKAQYYQRFIEDQALAESMGLIGKSAVTAFLEDYYEKNPLDNSYEGILARYSGLDKQTVADTLDIIWYFDYIANYDPEERYAFVDFEVEEPAMNFDNEYVLASGMKATEEMVYADVRNRSFAI